MYNERDFVTSRHKITHELISSLASIQFSQDIDNDLKWKFWSSFIFFRRETPEECRRTYRLKRCEYNNKDENNGPNILNDNFFFILIKSIIVSLQHSRVLEAKNPPTLLLKKFKYL